MIPYIETHIADECNLKCAGCSHFSGLSEVRHKDIDDFQREFKRLAEIEEIQTIRIMGGEPLLNPDFMDYLRIARRFFPDSRVVLVTNGLLFLRLVPHRQELEALRINVTVSDYHLGLHEEYSYTERHDKGQMYNISLDPSGSQGAVEAFSHCDLHLNGWTFFQDGRMYPCCIAGCIRIFWKHFGLDWGLTPEDLGIDIFTHTAEEIEAFLTQPIPLCRYCDTVRRETSYHPFTQSKGEISEWT